MGGGTCVNMSKQHDKALPVFDHKLTSSTPRDRLFQSFNTSVNYYLSKEHGVLGTAAMIKPDPNDLTWGTESVLATQLAEHWFYDEELISKWFKVQSDLMFILHRSFHDHDAVIVDSHDFLVLQAKYKVLLDSRSAPFDHKDADDAEDYDCTYKFRWLPFGSMCLYAIGLRYQLTGVTDCIAKVYEFDVARNAFSPDNVRSWTEMLEEKWKLVKAIVEKYDPDYLAAMQILINIGRSGTENWKAWSTQFSRSKGSTQFTVAELLADVLQHDLLLRTQKQTESQILGNAHAHAASIVSLPVCETDSCTKKVRLSHHKFCPSCFKKRNTGESNAPPKVAEALKAKIAKKMKKNYARKMKKKAAKATTAAAAASSSNANASVADIHVQPSHASASFSATTEVPKPVQPGAIQGPDEHLKTPKSATPLKKFRKKVSLPHALAFRKLKGSLSKSTKKNVSSKTSVLKQGPNSLVATAAASSLHSNLASDIFSWNPDTEGAFVSRLPWDPSANHAAGDLSSAFTGFGSLSL